MIEEDEREGKKESTGVRVYIDTRCETRASKLSIYGSTHSTIRTLDKMTNAKNKLCRLCRVRATVLDFAVANSIGLHTCTSPLLLLGMPSL